MGRFAPFHEWSNAYFSTQKADLSTQRPGTAKYGAPSSDPVEPSATPSAPRVEFRNRAKFWWKTFILAATTIALIPIMLWQHELAATIYLWALVIIHVIGLAIFIVGVSREDIAPSTWGFVGRLIGLVTVGVLLYILSKGLQTPTAGALFWISLFLIWAVHTAGLLMLHLRGSGETSCPFA